MLKLIYEPFLVGRPAIGLLLFRIVTGAALMVHGYPKMMHPFSWMPGDAVPGFFQMLAAVAEFGGGLCLLLGFLTPFACIMIMGNMLVAIYLGHLSRGGVWIGAKNSYESALGYFISATMLLLTGPGIYSLDAKMLSNRLFRFERNASQRGRSDAVLNKR